MSAWIVPPRGLIEPVPAPVHFIDEIGAISVSNGIISIYYCALRPSFSVTGECDSVVSVVLQRPISSFIEAHTKMAALAEFCRNAQTDQSWHPRPPSGSRPRLVT